MNRSDCPDPSHLLKLLAGQSDSDSVRRIEAHLLECEPCALSAETLFPDNEITAFRQASAIRFEDSRDEVLVEALIDRARKLRTDSATALPEQTQISMSLGADDVQGSSKPSRADFDSSDDISYLAPAQQADEIGRLGDYRVLQILGRGGMGVVFLAEDPLLKRQVALKVMKPSIAASRSAKDRFLREAQCTAAIEHDHIVHIYQVGEDQGVPFIAMPFLKGESLKTKLEREGRLQQSEVVRIGKEVAAGLSAAHERGLIHRDIKPDNIWIEQKTGRARILDFGLVRSVSDDTELTQSGMVLGTPKYMAPEQAQGQNVDHRCDLFSLGSVLYHLATGKPAFEGNNLTATLMAVVHQEPRPIEAVSPEIHPQLSSLIAELVKKNRDQRPQSASLVSQRLADIEQAMKNPSAVTAGSLETLSNGSRAPIESIASTNIAEATIVPQPVVRRTPPRPPRGNKLALVAGAGGLLLMLGILIITIRDKDGKETIVRVPSGVVADIDVQPGSKVSIREEASGASDATDAREMKSPVVAEKELQAHNGNNVGKAGAADKPKLWPVGPLPAWASEEPRWTTMKESSTIPGAVERPTEFKEIGRWNVDTVHSRGLILVARYSPDSKWLATGGSDGHVRIYEAASMKLHQLLPGIVGGGAGAGDLSWHPDSQKIAVAADRQLRIWKVDGQLVHEEFPDDSLGDPLKAVAWTFDGSRLICAGTNRLDFRDTNGLVIKSLTEGLPVLDSHFGILAVSPNSQRFVCWHRDKARIWNAETYELEQTIDFPSSGSHRIRWSSKDRISLSLSDRLVICEADGSVLKEFPSESLCATAWRPDGENLTIWRWDLYNLNTQSGDSTPADQRMSFSGQIGTIPTAIDWSPDGKHLVVAGGRLAVCNETFSEIEFDTQGTLLPASCISMNPDGSQIASASQYSDNCVRIWSSDGTAQSSMSLTETLTYRGRVAWSPDGRHVAVGWPQASHFRIEEVGGSFVTVAGNCESIAWNPEGTQLAAGLNNGHILITGTNGKTLHDLDTEQMGAVNVAWSKFGTLVAHAGQKILRINPDSTDSKITLLTEAPGVPTDYMAVWRPDGKEVCISHDLHLNVADGVTERIRRAKTALAWAPDGSKYLNSYSVLASLHRIDGNMMLGRITNASSSSSFTGAWSPDGKTVFIGQDQSLLVARNADDLHVKWSAVLLPNQKSVTFDVGGSILDGDSETLEREFAYYAADKKGNVRLLSVSEFELQTGEEILPVPGRHFDSEYRFAISTGDDWKPAPSEAFTVPGIARASYSRPGGVSLNLFIQETGAYVDPDWLVNESATAQEEKLSATVREKEVRRIAGRDAMWMIVEGQGNGSAIDGKGPVKTTQQWIAIPREKDVLVALMTSPAGTFESNQKLFLKAIETLKLRAVNTTP
jgi:serine/threonine protein kinase/WD40 repeat protein